MNWSAGSLWQFRSSASDAISGRPIRSSAKELRIEASDAHFWDVSGVSAIDKIVARLFRDGRLVEEVATTARVQTLWTASRYMTKQPLSLVRFITEPMGRFDFLIAKWLSLRFPRSAPRRHAIDAGASLNAPAQSGQLLYRQSPQPGRNLRQRFVSDRRGGVGQ